MSDTTTGDAAGQIAFYGTLMSRFDTQDQLGVREQLRLLGRCRIGGRLFDLGEWPTLVLGAGVVHGEVFELLDASALSTLDRFEDCDPTDAGRSSYLRVRVALLEPSLTAWIYVTNGTPVRGVEITSGCWPSWLRTRSLSPKDPRNTGD
jgi:gamma-glutamylcyclotransferase (GGCT)/AIG2-like uncharacterized protein YtfP